MVETDPVRAECAAAAMEGSRWDSRAAILWYHGVTDRSAESVDSPDLQVPLALFEAQMRLVARHCRPLPLSEVVVRLRADRPLPRRAVCITFDDAYANVHRCALPVLRRLGLPACLFVAPDLSSAGRLTWWDLVARLARGGTPLSLDLGSRAAELTADTLPEVLQWLKELPDGARSEAVARLRERAPEADGSPGESALMSPEEVRDWSRAGQEVGSHTMTHGILSRVPPDRLAYEVGRSREILRDLTGCAVDLFCYPNGKRPDMSEATREALVKAGYAGATTTIRGRASGRSDPLALPRLNGNVGLARFVLALTGVEDSVRALLRKGD